MRHCGGSFRGLATAVLVLVVAATRLPAVTPAPAPIRLSDNISAEETRIPVTSFIGLPTNGGTITIDAERIRYGGLEFGDRLILVTQRGADGTVAAPHEVGAFVLVDPTPSPTPSITRTETVSPTPSLTFTPTPTRTFRPTATPGKCIGDCNQDGEVTVDEIVVGVNKAFGVDVRCDAFEVVPGVPPSVTELVAAVRNSLEGCPANLPRPDLDTTTAGIGAQTPCGDDPPFVLGLCIANLGSAPSGRFLVRITPWNDEFVAESLLAGEQRCFTREAEGFRGTIVLDPGNAVAELVESNNSLPFEFPPRSPLPRCTRTPTPTFIRDTPTPR